MIKSKRALFTLGAEIAVLILVFVLIITAIGADNAAIEFEKYEYPKKYAYAVEIASAEFDLPENLIYAVIKAESDFDSEAVSSAGAVGLMQVMPSTYDNDIKPKLGLKKSGKAALLNYMINIRSGTYYLAYLYEYCGDLETALAMYNAGIGNVSKWLENREYSYNGKKIRADRIPVEETRTYVARVMYYYERYNDIYGKKSQKVIDDPIFKKYGVKIKWVTKTDDRGNLIVNELACYAWAKHYGEIYTDVDPVLVMAIIKTESDFVVNAVSTSNAYGLMQIMEATYSDIRKKMPTDEKFSNILAEPKFAIQCGMCYLQWLNTPSLKLGGSRINIAAAYNGGCGNVRKWLETDGCARRGVLIADRIPREETRNYVKKVEENYKYYREYLGAIFADI